MSNKTSDENVATKDDIEILKEFAETCKKGISLYNPQKEGEALERVLAELEKMLKEREKYTIRLTDEEYRRVIDIVQKDVAEQKDKRIKSWKKKIRRSR